MSLRDDRQHLIRHCLAIVLRPHHGLDPPDPCPDNKASPAGPGPPADIPPDPRLEDGYLVFRDFVRENGRSFWNPCLVQSVATLEYKGYLVPTTLLVTGCAFSLDVIRSAWGRRVLRPPQGFDITRLGDVSGVEMTAVSQTQFAPLVEALCAVIYQLNAEQTAADLEVIGVRLRQTFPEIEVPAGDVLYRALGALIKERKLYHTGRGYFIVTPETYRRTAASPPTERQMLMTNDEAIVRLHARDIAVTVDLEDVTGRRRSLSVQADSRDIVQAMRLERSLSLRFLKARERNGDRFGRSNSVKIKPPCRVDNSDSKSDSENHDPQKREKLSVFSKLFRRSHSREKPPKGVKYATFSAQFPPVEWSDPSYAFYHSRGTQTVDRALHPTSKFRSISLSRTMDRNHSSAHAPTPRVERRSRVESGGTSRTAPKSASLPRKSYPVVESLEKRTANGTLRRTSPKNGHRSLRHSSYREKPASTSTPKRPTRTLTPSADSEKLNNIDKYRHDENYKELNITANELLQRPKSRVSHSSNVASSSSIPKSSTLMSRFLEDATALKNFRTSSPVETIRSVCSGKPQHTPETLRSSALGKKTSLDETHPTHKTTANAVPIAVATPRIIEIKNTEDPCKPEAKKNVINASSAVDMKISVESPTTKEEKLMKPNHDKEEEKKTAKKEVQNGRPETIKTNVTTRWNSVISENTITTSVATKGHFRPVSVSTVTNITTSMSHGALKDLKKCDSVPEKPRSRSVETSPVHDAKRNMGLLHGDADPAKVICDLDGSYGSLYTPLKLKLAEAKAAFFANKSNTDSFKDDSGFLSASSNPINVTVCP